MSRTAGEEDFITEYTRSLLVPWANLCIKQGYIVAEGDIHSGVGIEPHLPYLERAREKGWVGKKNPPCLTSSGFKAAASFLRR